MRAAAVQLNSTGDKDRNLEAAERLVRAAATDGAELVALPEKWNLLAGGEELLAGAEPLDGPCLSAARGWARELGIHLLAGSISERGAEKAFNTSVLIGPEGEDLAVYRKIHMFDVDVGGVSYRESDHEEPGAEIVTAPVGELLAGLSVCYDLRFPELYRILARARGPPARRALRLHAGHRPRPLGGAAAGAGDREPGLRPRSQPGRRGAAAFQLLRALGDRRPLGHGARPRPRRRGLRRRRPRPRRAGPRSASRCPRSPTAVPVPTPGRSSRRCSA